MDRFLTGNRIGLLRSGREYFPALERAIDSASSEIWLESYIFADDPTGRRIAEALSRAAQRGVKVRVLVDGWGVKFYLTVALERAMHKAGVELLKYRPEVSPWQFRSHRLRRLHRKLCHVDHRIGFVGGINVIDDMNTPGHKPPRVDFAVSVEGPLVPAIAQTMQRVWALVQLVQFGTSQLPLFPERRKAERVGTQTARFIIRDNLRHRRDIEQAYLAAIRAAKKEILIANSYFFPGITFRRELVEAVGRGVAVTLLLQAKVEYVLLHFASRAMYGQFLQAGVVIQEYHASMLHAKVAVIDDRWATVGSSNIDPYSLLMAREANVVVRDRGFAAELRQELKAMIETGSRPVVHQDWQSRSRLYKAAIWVAYGIVRVAMGLLGYTSEEWFPKRAHRTPGRASAGPG
ncbi:MAG TPA: cardiolipin synthase ClsB [Casimicrobiaceae bacterium]|nr:cardiolipin synthase ClsB [Casimicrobiaceae bacterium]